MAQGVLGFQYEEERNSTGMTALGGLPAYLDMAQVSGLRRSIEGHVRLRDGGQGWSDSQMIMALLLLNLAGGDSVDDLRVLEKDEGFCRVLRGSETYRLARRNRRAIGSRWRIKRRRTVPSPSAVFRYLSGFHDQAQESERRPERAFIPVANKALRGLRKVNRDMLGFIQSKAPQVEATLDMDACLVETQKRDALWSYKGHKAYQPLTTYWAEQDAVVDSEFRDGNVPAGYEQLRVMKESLEMLPPGVQKVYLRSDTAGYQWELLKYCAQANNKRFGLIEFAVGVDVTPEFKGAVAQVAEQDWQSLDQVVDGHKVPTGQQWAEVCFVPEAIGRSKEGPEYRYLAIREPMRQAPLPGMDEQLSLPFPAMELTGRGWYKVFGIVTNRKLAGDELIRWSRQRCGKSEQVHGVMKADLAAGKLPSSHFGVNAAWWAIAVLAFNLNSAMKRLVLGQEWKSKRLKAVRFALISLPGRVVRRARRLIIRLSRGHPSYAILLAARRTILALAHSPP